MVLRELNEDDEEAFLKAAEDWAEVEPYWFSFIWTPGMPYASMLKTLRDESLGRGLKPGRVPAHMLYGFQDGVIVGRVSIRHKLNESLRLRGGHIGYAVAPRFRRKGYATAMVQQALEFCRERLRLNQVMLTCADANEASWRIIEKFGGVMEDCLWDPEDSELARRYWIEL